MVVGSQHPLPDASRPSRPGELGQEQLELEDRTTIRRLGSPTAPVIPEIEGRRCPKVIEGQQRFSR